MERKFPGYSFEDDQNSHQAMSNLIVKMIGDSNTDDISLPVVYLKGTPFQKKVWAALRQIPRGETKSYAEIAEMINSPNSTRSVGTAIGKNNHAVYIPCHRVIPKAYGTGQYRWGCDLKKVLLDKELNDCNS